jgi:antitoxin CptB
VIDLAARRRRIRFRAWHRGIRELDLLMGRFADLQVESLSGAEIEDFERLLEASDHDVFAWLTGEAMPEEGYDTPLFRKLRGFHTPDPPPRR